MITIIIKDFILQTIMIVYSTSLITCNTNIFLSSLMSSQLHFPNNRKLTQLHIQNKLLCNVSLPCKGVGIAYSSSKELSIQTNEAFPNKINQAFFGKMQYTCLSLLQLRRVLTCHVQETQNFVSLSDIIFTKYIPTLTLHISI